MIKKRNIIIIAIVMVMLAIVVLVFATRKNSTLKQDINIADVETITRVYLSDKNGNNLMLKKVTDSIWVINDSDTANYNMIKTLLSTLSDMRVREPIPKPAHKNILTQLAGQRTEVQVYQQRFAIDFWFIHLFKKDKLTKNFYVGTETQDNMGTYMMLKGKEPCVAYVPHFRGYLVTRFLPYIDLWKSHNVFKCNPKDIASIRIELPKQNKESFELYQQDNTFKFKLLNSGELLNDFDTMKVTALISSFIELNYESVAKEITQLERDTIFAKEPNFIITLKDQSGKSRSLKTYVKLYNPNSWVDETDKSDFYKVMDVDRMYAVAEGMKDTLIFQFFVMDNILNPASYYFDSNNR